MRVVRSSVMQDIVGCLSLISIGRTVLYHLQFRPSVIVVAGHIRPRRKSRIIAQ